MRSTSPVVWPAQANRWVLTALYYAGFAALGLAAASLGPTLGDLARHTHTRLSEISFVFSASRLGYLIGSFVAGRMFDRWPGHLVMVGMLIMMAAMLALAPLMPLLWLLTAVVLVLGMGEGAMDLGGNTLLMWVHRSQVGPFMNGLHFAWGVGAFLSPIIVAQAVLISGDITWAYWTLALLMFPVVIGLLSVSSPVAPANRHASQAGRADHVLLVVLIAMLLFLYVGAEGSLGGWIFTYTVTLGLSSQAAAAYLTSAFWGAITVGRLLAIPIAARLRPRSILLMDVVGCVIGISIIVLWPTSLVAVWVGAVGTGLAMASVFPTVLALAESRMHITGRITAWFFVGTGLGGMTVPWIIGQLFEPIGATATMATIMVTLVLMAGVCVALLLATRKAISP
jgi:MFS transporter, FHS family, Na+ dependent glucose transporter 1